jgi:hypothetical protein
VEIEGTDEKDISVLVGLKATSEVLAEGMKVSINGNEVVITVPKFYILLTLDGRNVFRTSRLYRT